MGNDMGNVQNFDMGKERITKPIVKQFVVTKCSKERPGSIVTKTLKNGILIPIATSKESHFKADLKYISFIKKICLIFGKEANIPKKYIH